MASVKLEYIWLDGYQPEPNMRSKTKVLTVDDPSKDLAPEDCPGWSFDGSSTEQAEGGDSDCLLQPVRVVRDTGRRNGFLVLCEVLNPDGSAHVSNTRALYEDEADLWFGFEQEYTVMDGRSPLGFPEDGYPGPQGPYYCSVGHAVAKGREIMEEHLDVCIDAGLQVTGTNAEVMMGQWEYQLFGKGAKRAADDAWLARYLLVRTAEKYGLDISIHPKPIRGDWNGSGMHTNFSNTAIREEGGKELIESICANFGKVHEEHIAVYGSSNELRLTGMHETQSIDKFSFGVSDRGASIRIPISTANNGYKGYLEDRRPASNADPYRVAGRIVETLKM